MPGVSTKISHSYAACRIQSPSRASAGFVNHEQMVERVPYHGPPTSRRCCLAKVSIPERVVVGVPINASSLASVRAFRKHEPPTRQARYRAGDVKYRSDAEQLQVIGPEAPAHGGKSAACPNNRGQCRRRIRERVKAFDDAISDFQSFEDPGAGVLRLTVGTRSFPFPRLTRTGSELADTAWRVTTGDPPVRGFDYCETGGPQIKAIRTMPHLCAFRTCVA